MRLGWIQDTHTHPDGTTGAQEGLIDDYNYLANTLAVDDIYHGGDLVSPSRARRDETPHVTAEYFDQFFSLIGRTDNPSLLKRCVPGNHDIPLSTFLAADETCVLRDRVDYPQDNLSVLCVNTHMTGIVTGSPGLGTQGSAGSDVARMAKADIDWMDRQLADIDSRGHSALIIPHTTFTSLPDCPWPRASGYNGHIDDPALYNIPTNHKDIERVLRRHAGNGLNIVVPVSHLFYFGNEGSQTVDGVNYVFKKHYWGGLNNNNELFTFAYIDMDGSGAAVTTVDHSSHAETTVLDVTF